MSQNAPIGVVFDFDGTLTPKEYISLIKIVEASCLPESLRAKTDKLREAYYKNAVPGADASAYERRLINASLRAYVKSGLACEQWKAALSEIKLRDGVSETLNGLTGQGIKVGIISFGVADFIEHVLEANGVNIDLVRIFAARLAYDKVPGGKVVNWYRKSVVHPFDKCVWSAIFARASSIAPDRLLAVGDSIGDKLLGLRKELRLGIAQDAEDAKNLSEFMGEVVVTENYAPVQDWINRQIAGLAF